MRLLLITLSLLLSITAITPSYSIVEEQVLFDNPKTEKRYKKLIAELRCLVCQNQSLADSDAELAQDLRRKTAEMLKGGASDKAIRTYMTERYGDFILYRPPFNTTTSFLWLGPFILLLAVLIGIVINIRKRQQNELYMPTRTDNEENTIKVRNLLRDTPELSSGSELNNNPQQAGNKADK